MGVSPPATANECPQPRSGVVHAGFLHLPDFGQLWGLRQKLESQFPATIKTMAKRNLFDVTMEGMTAMEAHREDKRTLRTCKVEPAKTLKVDSSRTKNTPRLAHSSERQRA